MFGLSVGEEMIVPVAFHGRNKLCCYVSAHLFDQRRGVTENGMSAGGNCSSEQEGTEVSGGTGKFDRMVA